MQYFGGKQRISKSLSQYLNGQLKDNQPFVDLFCGSCNVISKINDNRLKIANDKHKYLMKMWKELQNGYELPNEISEEEYQYIKNHKEEDMCLTGFVGFGCSFAGKWFGGYARNKKGDNYCLRSKKSTMNKSKKMKTVVFCNEDYKDVKIPEGSMVYCDIPYLNTTQYCSREVGKFDHNEFYQWVRDNCSKYEIYVSEYECNKPEDFEIVWKTSSRKSIRDKNNTAVETVEVLLKYKN
ncbi:DNA adenine methylase [Terrisporobacter sp.]|uniref:DNA adenine methylase n=1 Tax=Terrisporobacter sp. TaxID=1965305 RepID=UPI002638266F|nr:DNA adenine methylase [Terrisporobacter sp.]